MSSSAENVSEFVKSLQSCLKDGNTVYALTLFNDNKNSDEVKNNSWDLIPIITKYFNVKCENDNIEAFNCCKQLINIIAECSNPEEALLQFIEEIEEATDDTKFITLLQPLQKVLVRVPKKRQNSLAWCFNAIQTYLNKLEIPEDCNLIGKEKLSMEFGKIPYRITTIYSDLLPFYDMFIEELKYNKNEEIEERCAILIKFLVQLLGKPIAFLDLEIFDNVKGKARVLAERLIKMIFQINCDPCKLLEKRYNKENNEFYRPGPLGIAVFFYLVFTEHIYINKIPKVYDTTFLFQNSLYLVTELFQQDKQLTTEKGLKLALTLLQYVKGRMLPYLLLDSSDHSKFCLALSKVIIYNQLEHHRKLGVKVYQTYIQSFEDHGCYLLTYNLILNLNHTGLIGFTITQYKEKIAKEFAVNESNMSEYFKGDKLYTLLKMFCHLHKNEESDLIEISDQIIASLNLLRFLTLRDKNNSTGIWDYIGKLEELFLTPLRKGIILSKAHYELKIKELKEENAEGDKQERKSKISVVVGDESLLEMPATEKLKVLYSSLTTFDVMDSLLSRLIECIDMRQS